MAHQQERAAQRIRLSAESKPRTLEVRLFHQQAKTILLGSILPAVLIVLWELLCRAGVFKPQLLPAPGVVLGKILELIRDGTLWEHVGVTFSRVITGFFLGMAVAVALGALVGYFKKAEAILDPTIQAFRSIPSLAWVPLFILWMGIGESSKVALIATGAFFPVYLNIVSGIQGVDRKLIEVGKIYGLNAFELVRRIILPASLPSFLVGLRSGLGLGWMFVVAAELMGAAKGLGFLLVLGQNTYSPEIIIASILLFALFGKLTDAALKFLEKKALHWQDSLANR